MYNKEYWDEYYRDPDNRKAKNLRSAAHYARYREPILRNKREKRREEPENYRASARKWHATNKDRVNASRREAAKDLAKRDPVLAKLNNMKRSRRRKALLAASTDGSVTACAIRDLIVRFPCCPYCDVLLDETNRVLDHKTPLAAGGPHSAGNLIPCCRVCNRAKSDMPYDKWLSSIGKSNEH